MKHRELIEKRNRLFQQSKEILDRAEQEGRALTTEERANHDKYVDEIQQLGDTIRALEQRDRLALEFAEPAPGETRGAQGAATAVAHRAIDDAQAFGRYAIRRAELGEQFGADVLREVDARSSAEYVAAGRRFLLTGEKRALSAGTAGAGGFTVMPIQFMQGLLKFLDDAVFIRARASVMMVPGAEALGIVAMDSDVSDADWTSELGTGSEDGSEPFGNRELRPHPLAKRLRVSNKLLRLSMLGIDSLLISRLGYKFAITEEKAFLTGHGAGQPLGIFTASSDGIPASRDVATGNTTTAITFDGLINAKYSLKGQYQQRAVWGFHRDAIKQIALIKDSQNRYIWEPSKVVGDPDRILGNEFLMSEYMPNTFTTGLYVGFFGDLSFYHIVDALGMTVQRLVELYAATNQTGFIGRKETDGQPVLAEAFARVKLA